MGTSGTGAGGGSGGSGGGGGGGGGTGAGVVTIRSGNLREVDPKEAQAREAIQSIFSKLPQDYIGFLAGDVGVGAAYEAMHSLHVMLVQEKSWDNVQKRFGVRGDKGCLRALADGLSKDEGATAVSPRLRAPLKATLMDFFRRVVGDDPIIVDSGTSAEVLAAVRPNVFQSTSAHFLGAYISEFLRQEETSLTKLARKRLRDFSEAKANQVVRSFVERFKGKPLGDIKQVGFSHLFRVMKEETEWLSKQLRRKVRPEPQASGAL